MGTRRGGVWEEVVAGVEVGVGVEKLGEDPVVVMVVVMGVEVWV